MATTRNSAQWIYRRLLAYIGVTNLNPAPTYNASDPLTEPGNANYVPEGFDEDCAGIITASLQDIFDLGPASISQIETGVSLFPPTNILCNPGNGEVVMGQTTILPWMKGCSVIISGDGFVNEIVSSDSTSVTLRRPYLGASAQQVSATVYGNAVMLDPSISSVLEPVEIGGGCQLTACGDRREFDSVSGCSFRSSVVNTGRPPSYYFVESRYDPSLTYMPLVLRVAYAPAQALPLTFRAKLNPPMVTAANLGTANADPGIMLPIPSKWVESILVPFCLQRLTGHALFKNEAAKPELARQYQRAKDALMGFQPQARKVSRYAS